MKIAIHVICSPYENQSNLSALRFTQAAIATGQIITRVFFSGEGVLSATALAVSPQDELDLYQSWQSLAMENGIELVVCISACLRRGIINQEEAERYQKQQHNMSTAFVLSGLGQLVDASLECDRLVTFGS